MPRYGGAFFLPAQACFCRPRDYGWRMKCLIASVLFVGSVSTVFADTPRQVDYQFWENAKLAGRALACGDAAGKASIRSASRRLSHALGSEHTESQWMQRFDDKVRLHHRFALRASPEHRGCDRNANAIKDSLRRTRVIAPQP